MTFVLEPFKGQTRLTVTHDDFDEGSKMFAMISKGWPAVLSSLKSFLERGTGLEPTWDDEQRSGRARHDRCRQIQAKDDLRHLYRRELPTEMIEALKAMAR